jgi:flagellar hook-associated protein 2
VTDPSNPTAAKEGLMQSLIKRNTDTVTALNNQVSAWDIRLALRKTSLQKTYANLEVALGKMQQQSSWLSSQLAGLPTS